MRAHRADETKTSELRRFKAEVDVRDRNDRTVDHLRQVDAEIQQVRIGRIDQMPEDGAPAGWEWTVFAAEGDDLMLDLQSGEPCRAVRL